jgi:Zn-dependent peptidase ImmA (M78 family)/transcriptional regulator with XRE-family HTH domain
MSRVQRDTPSVDTLGARLREQRLALGLTVHQLAQRLGVNRNTITNYESDKTEPSVHDLVRLAATLGCDLVDLLPGMPRAQVPRFAFRAHKVLSTDPHIKATARKYLRAYMDIEEILGTTLALRLPQYPLEGDVPQLERRIEGLANRVRKSCGIRDCGPDNMVAVLENLGVRCLFFQYDGRGLDGVSTLQDEMCLMLLRVRDKGIERTISSAAHELGHLVLHPHLFTEELIAGGPERNYEKEAQLFAGYFLVPSDDLLEVWEGEGLYRLPPVHALLLLKRVFRVSFWFVYERVRQAGLVPPNEYPRLITAVKRLLGIRGRAKMEELEPELLPRDMLQRSTRFERLVRSAFLQGKIGVAKVAEMLQISVEEATEQTAHWVAPEHDLVG